MLLCLALVIVLISCSDLSFRTLRESGPAAQQSVPARFEDIPIPPGLILNQRESFVYETTTTRTGLLVYEGKGEMEQLALFFKGQMPKYQWRLLSNFEIHNAMLTFVKEGWISIIYIIPKDTEENRIEIRFGPIEDKILPASK